jgi:hypothetical protein
MKAQGTEDPRVRGSIPQPGIFKIKGLGDFGLPPFPLLVVRLHKHTSGRHLLGRGSIAPRIFNSKGMI